MNDINTALVDSQAEGPEQTLPKIVVLHIPHSSRQVPTEERQAVLLDDARLNNELLRMYDGRSYRRTVSADTSGSRTSGLSSQPIDLRCRTLPIG